MLVQQNKSKYEECNEGRRELRGMINGGLGIFHRTSLQSLSFLESSDQVTLVHTDLLMQTLTIVL